MAYVRAADASQTLSEELQQVLDSELKRHNGIGVSAAVIIPGRKPWLGASGVSHGSTTITSDMVFSVGSNTKNFMAALTLQLAEEKKLHKELKKIEKEEKEIGKAESLLEKNEKNLLKEVKNLEAEEAWDSGMRFYCKFKMMDDNSAITCNKLPGKPCSFRNCPKK